MAFHTSQRLSMLLVCIFLTHVISGMMIRAESREQHPDEWFRTNVNKRSVDSLVAATQSATNVCLKNSVFRTMMQELVNAEINRLQSCMAKEGV